MRFITAFALVCLAGSVSTRSASAKDILDQMIADKQACVNALELNEREGKARSAQLKRIGDEDYAALCRYGRTIGQPGLERAAKRLQTTRGCRASDDFFMKAVVERQIKIVESNKRAVESDCRKART